VIVLLLGLASGSAAADDRASDRVTGLSVAIRQCAGCHAVSEAQSRPATDAAPAFITIARDPTITDESLRVFLKTPHPRMPSVILSPEDADHVVSYVRSLRLNN